MSAVTLKHGGLPEDMRPFQIIDLVSNLRKQLGLSHTEIAYLRLAITKVRRDDFLPGRICAFWLSAQHISEALQISLRQLTRIEATLEAKGLIARTWQSKRRRFGRRDADGRIVSAGGVNLGPLVDQAKDLIVAQQTASQEKEDLKDASSQAAHLIRAIRALANEEALEAAKAILPRLRSSEVTSIKRMQEVISALSAVYESFEDDLGQTEMTAASDKYVRPITNDNINNKKSTSSAPRSKTQAITPMQVRLLASTRFGSAINFYSKGLNCTEADWQCIALAARDIAAQHGLSARSWEEACSRLGVHRTILCLLIVDRNHDLSDRWKVRDVAKAFKGLTHKEALGQDLLEKLLGQARRSLRQCKEP